MIKKLFAPLLHSQRFRLNEFPATIGRGGEVTVQIEDRFVSRFQCQIDLRDGDFFLNDLGSRHGTLVNGAPIQSCPIRTGDVVQLGLRAYRVRQAGRKIDFTATQPGARSSAKTAGV